MITDWLDPVSYKLGQAAGAAVDPDKWHRPSDWPDLDALTIPDDFDGIYLTYDLRKMPDCAFIGVNAILDENQGTFSVDRGHIEGSTFIADETHGNNNSNTDFTMVLDSAYGNVQLWRVTATTHITAFGFVTMSGLTNTSQPCVEKAGRLDYLTTLASIIASTTARQKAWETVWMESDTTIVGCKSVVTSLSDAWNRACSLQHLDVSKWNTEDWEVTSINRIFQDAGSLKKLDLRSLDTSSWNVASFNSCFDGANGIESLLVSENFSIPGLTFPAPRCIIDFSGYPANSNVNISSWGRISRQSLLNIIDRLPETQTTLTLTLGWHANRLTAAEIAVATAKGWTVA